MSSQRTESIIDSLERHQRRLEQSSQYVDARLVGDAVAGLQSAEDEDKLARLLAKQRAELQAIRAQYESELAQFHEEWESNIGQYEANVADSVGVLRERQAYEMRDLTSNLPAPSRPRASKQVLNLRHIEAALVGQKRYSEAETYKRQADVLEAESARQSRSQDSARHERLLGQLKAKHAKETALLADKIELTRKRQQQIRTTDLEQLQLRYEHAIKDMTNQHGIQRGKLEVLLEKQQAHRSVDSPESAAAVARTRPDPRRLRSALNDSQTDSTADVVERVERIANDASARANLSPVRRTMSSVGPARSHAAAAGRQQQLARQRQQQPQQQGQQGQGQQGQQQAYAPQQTAYRTVSAAGPARSTMTSAGLGAPFGGAAQQFGYVQPSFVQPSFVGGAQQVFGFPRQQQVLSGAFGAPAPFFGGGVMF